MYGISTPVRFSFASSLAYSAEGNEKKAYQSPIRESEKGLKLSWKDGEKSYGYTIIPKQMGSMPIATQEKVVGERAVQMPLAAYVNKMRQKLSAIWVLSPDQKKEKNHHIYEFSLRNLGWGKNRHVAVFNTLSWTEEFSKSVGMLIGYPFHTLIFKVLLPTLGLLITSSWLAKKLGCEEWSDYVKRQWQHLVPIKALFVGLVGHFAIQLIAALSFGLLSTYFNRLSGDLERWVNGHTWKDLKQKTVNQRMGEAPYLAPCQQPQMVWSKEREGVLSAKNLLIHIKNVKDRARALKMVRAGGMLVSMRPAELKV